MFKQGTALYYELTKSTWQGPDPIVTVLMSVYNGEQYLNEAIDSILKQCFTDFEFIIVDGGSNDRSIQIIDSYSDLRIRLIVPKESRLRLAESLNIGLDLARGKYIARMDADDVSLPERLQTQVEFMEKNKEIGICGTWVQTMGNRDGHIVEFPVTSDEIKGQMLFTCGFCHPSVMFRKAFLDIKNFRYSERCREAEDYEFWVRLSSETEYANIPKVLVKYRISGQQVTSKNRETCLDCGRQIQVNLLKSLGIQPSIRELYIHDMFVFEALMPYKDAIDDGMNWLIKLEEANVSAKIFSEKSFRLILHRYWLKLQKINFTFKLMESWINLCYDSSKTIALWGSGMIADYLVSTSRALKERTACVVDNNTAKHGTLFKKLDVPICHPNYLKQNPVDMIVIASLGSAREIENDIRNKYKIDCPIISVNGILEKG